MSPVFKGSLKSDFHSFAASLPISIDSALHLEQTKFFSREYLLAPQEQLSSAIKNLTHPDA